MTADPPDVETWETVVADLEPATWAEVGYELADREDLSPETALDLVDDALADGVLEENTDSGTETLSVAAGRTDPDDDGGDADADTNSTGGDASTEGDSAGGGGPRGAEPRETGVNSGVNPETRRTDPGARAAEPGSPAGDSADSADSGLPGYEILLREAQARADREPWEPVEEPALRGVLDEYGVAHLLDDGVLGRTSRWRVVDLSDDEEEPRRRWYYATGEEPRPDEFRRFDELLTSAAPDGYEPHYFRVARAGKDPATQFGSWKRDEARLTVEEAVAWMEKGGNVGVSGRGECKVCDGDGTDDGDECNRCDGTGDLDGLLVNVDIDDDEETTPDDVPASLRARSRSRTGWHTWYFDRDGEIPNIATDEYGEVRTDWQYVVVPGSFVPSTAETVPDGADNPGYYTVEDPAPVASIGYEDLPEVFLDAAETDDEQHTHADPSAGEGAGGGDTATGHTHTDDLVLDDDDLPDGAGGAVFDVDAEAVLSGSPDASDRFSSVFHDSTTGANMSLSREGRLHCWRHGVAHGGLQALAVLSDKTTYGCRDLGAPHKNSGAGRNRLKGDWRLVWAAWHYAKRRGHIPTDDPLPYRVLLGLAVEGGVVDGPGALVERAQDTGSVVENADEYDGDTYTALPSGTYNDALEYADEQADVALGRDPVDTGGEPVAALPLARLEALDDEAARRYARDRGLEWPDTEAVRDRLHDTIRGAFADEQRAIVDAPTGSGKTYAVGTTPWRDLDDHVTGGEPVVHLSGTRDARDEAHEDTRAELGGENTHRLLGGPEACACAAGAHDPRNADDDEDTQVVTVDGEPVSTWLERMVQGRGVPFSVAHGWAREYNDQGLPNLPCAPGDLECRSKTQWATVPRTDEGEPAYDVIHATHQFAHVPSLRHDVNLVFDEEPDFTADISHERARTAVSAFLTLSENGPDTWEELVGVARELDGNPFDEDADPQVPGGRRVNDLRDRYLAAVEALEFDPPREWYLHDTDAHTLARPIAEATFRALVDADPFDRNGRTSHRVKHHPPRFDDDAHDAGYWNREWVTVVLDDSHTIRRVRAAPDLSGARAVVGLDALPEPRVWRRNTGPDMTRAPVLEREERRLWRLFERELRTVQVGEAVRPKGADAEYYDREGDAALVEQLRERFNLRSGVVPKAVQDEFAEILEEHGADVDRDETGDPRRVLTFGNEKSRNELAGDSVGFVSHCLDPGDEYVLDLLAECDLDAEPARVGCPTCDGEGCSACAGTGERREHGRTFDGPDADAAEDFLGTVREQHLVQSAGRYARNPDDDGDGALVFVRSAALPDRYTDLQVPGVEWVATDKQRAVVEALQNRPGATAADLAAAADVSREHVRQTLKRLADEDDVEVLEHAGDHGAHLYKLLTDGRHEPAVVDLEATGTEETSNSPVWVSSTWSLAITAPTAVSPTTTAPTPRSDTATPGEQLGLGAFDTPPPDD